ncbi:hypothetical protein [Marinobacter halotolerans]|uniref:hypothetical protein n=1 Tax=Marinobacter halotolerans TaxID=1569211 RepID=UPI001245BCA8|nr:hypothetical protein [Marinobacter halotolerans]
MKHLEVCSQTKFHWQPAELVNALLSRPCRNVIRHWIRNEHFLGADNEPRLLRAYGDKENGFDRLVYQCDSLLSPAVVRNELLRKGVVELTDDDRIMLRRSAYVPEQAVVHLFHGADGARHARAY